MKDLKVGTNLRLRAYESGFVLEQKKKAKDGKLHWTGLLWWSTIPAALVGVSNHLAKISKKDLPLALKEAGKALTRLQKAVLDDERLR